MKPTKNPNVRPMTAKNYGTVSAARQKEMTRLEFVRGLANG